MRWLLIGAVPDVVEHAIAEVDESAIVDRQRSRPEKHHADFAIVSGLAAQAAATAMDELDYSGDVPYALAVDMVDTQVLQQLFLPFSAFPLIETNHTLLGERAKQSEIAEQLRGALEMTSPDPESSSDSVEIGTHFSNAADYSKLRSLSLISPAMGEFMRDLRDAVKSMRVVDEDAPLTPPWDSDDRSNSAFDAKSGTLVGAGRPNLSDVMWAASLDSGRAGARKLLDSAPAWDQAPPHLLILGDSGTGKTLVANLVRDWLFPDGGPYEEVNCGGLGGGPQLDHALHGAAAGVWTHVERPVIGHLARAAYGLVFFDEIGDLTLDAQKRLLTYLGDNRVSPAGIQSYFGRTRVIAATNRDLSTLVARGRFRHDFLWRFGKRVRVPSLAERAAEIPRLIHYAALNPVFNPISDLTRQREVTHFEGQAFTLLADHDYSEGNFRELEYAVHSALQRAIRRRSRAVEVRDLAFHDHSFQIDRDSNVVDLASGLDPTPDEAIHLLTRRDLDRLAQMTRQPILKDPRSGALMVHSRSGRQVYVWRPSA